ncbi:hypothetical protein [Streptomyces sp. TS71-3]|uniref:COG4315 family predicted lipoprotein n=1 Tax=Streptomyces sp. TS71-3 TaxID=2733862 RepID=UPI001B16E3C6|nr:hypothetical protein [Streptomyces sp. TS71-3]GHJ41031.1 hypothetical protein Sm713_66400 [Streptomyces sp. TS71-3]
MTIRGKRKFSTKAGIGIAGVAVAALATACGSSTSGDNASGGSSTPASSPSSSGSSSGSGSGSGSSSGAGAATGVKAMSGDLGTFLTDSSGKTLYLFAADSDGKPTCNGTCAAEWPPLTAKGAPKAGAGVTASDLTTAKRSDGTSQVVYHGHPLYYFADDKKAGDAKGQGLDDEGGKWYVLSPSGHRITKSASGSSVGDSDSDSGSSGGSGSGGSSAGGGWG